MTESATEVRLRRLAGVLMLASTTTHLSEPFLFPWNPVLVVALLFGVSFGAIGILLLRGSRRVLFWGALLPLTAAFLGTVHSIANGYMHPLTRWHLCVDLVVGPICLYLLRRQSASSVQAKAA
jgi:hypothetical protein